MLEELMTSGVIDLQGVNAISVTLRLFLATLCGGLIGVERGKKHRAAGFRTHILVCIGATLAMLTNQYIMQTFNTGGDPSRIGAQVISGIGFLGAGTIIVTGKQQVKGLTTAAGLWASAAMGLAIGIGFYEGAIIGCLFILGVITVLQRVDEVFYRRSNLMVLYIEVNDIKDCKDVLNFLKQNCSKVYTLEINKNNDYGDNAIGILCSIKLNEKKRDTQIMDDMRLLQGVEYVEDIG